MSKSGAEPSITDWIGLVETISGSKILACIYCSNAERKIAKLIVKSRRFVDQIIVCDDGSNDFTFDIAQHLGVNIVKNLQRLGFDASLKTFFSYAQKVGADFVVVIDGDGSYDPSEIPVLLDPMRNREVDIVIGSRFLKGGVVEWAIGNTNVISSDLILTDIRSGFKAFNIKALNALTLTDKEVDYGSELLVYAQQIGLKVIEVPIRSKKEKDSSSVSPYTKTGSLTLRDTFLKRPLTIFGVPGLLAIAAGLVLWAYTLLTLFNASYVSTIALGLGTSSLFIGLTLVLVSIILWVVQNNRWN